MDAHLRMTVADSKGPGIIRHLHVTRHDPEQLMSRGVVLISFFDDAKQPAVMCPLADFFGDGCGGDSMNFSSKFIECAPWSYNCYFPMPFKKRAKVILCNDTDKDIMDYRFVDASRKGHEVVKELIKTLDVPPDAREKKDDANTVEIYSLKHVDGQTIAAMAPVVVPRAMLTFEHASKRLIAYASASDHERLKELIKRIDVLPEREEQIKVFHLIHAEAAPMAQAVSEILDMEEVRIAVAAQCSSRDCLWPLVEGSQTMRLSCGAYGWKSINLTVALLSALGCAASDSRADEPAFRAYDGFDERLDLQWKTIRPDATHVSADTVGARQGGFDTAIA